MNKLIFDDGHVEEVSDAVWNMSVAKSRKIESLQTLCDDVAKYLYHFLHSQEPYGTGWVMTLKIHADNLRDAAKKG